MEWIARQRLSIAHILHLLDDFLIVASSATLCQAQLDLFLNLCSYLGIPMAPEKTCGPATTLSFAGIELDSILSEARLPLDKIDKSRNLISALSLAIKFCGLNPARYKGHSFRIGAASHAADRGLSDAQIRVLGRWKSNAFHRYIRIPSVST